MKKNLVLLVVFFLLFSLEACRHGGGGETSCFLAGTLITMEDGSLKNIEEVIVGDVVKAFDESTGEIIASKVFEIESPTREGYYNLNFVDGREVQVTNEHPFYAKKPDGTVGWCSLEPDKTRKFYVHLRNIQQLEVGDRIYTDQEQWVEITELQYFDGPVQTYNLKRVEKGQSFFANGLLAHNKGGDGC